jgi:hypothetical protein
VPLPFGADLYQAVSPGGTVALIQMFETAVGSAIPQAVSGVTITITAAQAGALPAVGPTGAGLVSADEATFTYQWSPPASIVPGDYLAVFSATGPNGAVAYTQVVTVAAPPVLTPAPGVYATVAQYREEIGDSWTPDMRVQARLRRASETIDRAMIGAAYTVDANGMPIDPGIINVFMRATCAQVEFDLANNDPAGVKSQYSSTSVGGVSATRTARAQGQAFPPLAPAAAQILHTVGGLPGAPLLGWLSFLRTLRQGTFGAVCPLAQVHHFLYPFDKRMGLQVVQHDTLNRQGVLHHQDGRGPSLDDAHRPADVVQPVARGERASKLRVLLRPFGVGPVHAPNGIGARRWPS